MKCGECQNFKKIKALLSNFGTCSEMKWVIVRVDDELEYCNHATPKEERKEH